MDTILLTSRRLAGAYIARLVATLLLLAGASRVAAAQEPPARLPAVVVTATPNSPGPRKIAGVVLDTVAFPIGDVEISIPALQRRVFSQQDGSFRFEGISPGSYAVRARKLGYGPQVRSIVVDSAGGVGAFALLPLARAMPPVVSSASRGGLSGVVGDTAFNSLVGAEVRVMGHGESTKTDSVGAFYMPLRPGRYIVSVQQAGYDYRLVSVNIPADSGRRITVFLPPLSRVPSHESANNLTDFEARLTWRSNVRSRVYTRADLQKLDIEWAYDAVNVAYAALCQGGGCMVDKDCAVIVNGGPETAELASLTVEDIESMEVYLGIQGPPPPALRKAGARGGRGVARWSFPSVPLSNTRIATAKNQARKCLTTYVWLR